MRRKRSRRGANSAAEGQTVSWGRTVCLGVGLISVVLGFFVGSWTMREALTALHRSDFVRSDFEVESFLEARSRSSASVLEGRVTASDEHYRTSRTNIVGLDVLRQLKKENRVKGYRAPIWYLQKQGWWRTVDAEFPFRVQSEEEFGQTSLPFLAGVNSMLFGGGYLLIRRSMGSPAQVARSG